VQKLLRADVPRSGHDSLGAWLYDHPGQPGPVFGCSSSRPADRREPLKSVSQRREGGNTSAPLGEAVCRVDGVRGCLFGADRGSVGAVRNSHHGSLLVDLISRNATCNGKNLKLISKECDVLVELMRHDSQALSYDQLFECCADFLRGLNQEDRKKRVLYIVLRLRHKIWWARSDLKSARSGPIETVRGFGYRYCSENLCISKNEPTSDRHVSIHHGEPRTESLQSIGVACTVRRTRAYRAAARSR
jgi:DNA-binding winged helix-turn-helix (wHTH) protein